MEQDTVGDSDSDEVPVSVAVRVCPPPPVTNPFSPQPQLGVQVNTLTYPTANSDKTTHNGDNGCREPGITETIITCKTGIRYNGIGHNGIRYIKTGIRYNAIEHNGIRYNREQESVITFKWAIWNQV